jgi:hypothetical protein
MPFTSARKEGDCCVTRRELEPEKVETLHKGVFILFKEIHQIEARHLVGANEWQEEGD